MERKETEGDVRNTHQSSHGEQCVELTDEENVNIREKMKEIGERDQGAFVKPTSTQQVISIKNQASTDLKDVIKGKSKGLKKAGSIVRNSMSFKAGGPLSHSDDKALYASKTPVSSIKMPLKDIKRFRGTKQSISTIDASDHKGNTLELKSK